MTNHELRTWSAYFAHVWSGEKTFDVRYDDRGFQKGDTVRLREWDPERDCSCRDVGRLHVSTCARYTGRAIEARIGFVLSSTPGRGNQRGFEGHGYVVFSLVDSRNVEDVALLAHAVAGGARRPVDRFTVTPADVADRPRRESVNSP